MNFDLLREIKELDEKNDKMEDDIYVKLKAIRYIFGSNEFCIVCGKEKGTHQENHEFVGGLDLKSLRYKKIRAEKPFFTISGSNHTKEYYLAVDDGKVIIQQKTRYYDMNEEVFTHLELTHLDCVEIQKMLESNALYNFIMEIKKYIEDEVKIKEDVLYNLEKLQANLVIAVKIAEQKNTT